MSYVCPECPAAAYCSHGAATATDCCSACPHPAKCLSDGCAGLVQTRPASVTAESLAALEQRLAECEKQLESMLKAHEVDRAFTAKRLDAVEPDITRLMRSAALNEDAVSEAEKRIDVLHKAHEADRGLVGAALGDVENRMEGHHARLLDLGKDVGRLADRLTALEQAASQQPSSKHRKSRSRPSGRLHKAKSTKGQKRGASSPPRKRVSAPRKR